MCGRRWRNVRAKQKSKKRLTAYSAGLVTTTASLSGVRSLSTTPSLARFGKALSNDPIWDMVPSRYEIGVPSHVQIRFGQHFHYQYILIFRTGTDLSSIKSPFEQVTNNIYFEP